MTQFVGTSASKLILRSAPIAGAATDTGRRLMPGQVAQSYGQTFDGAWQFVRAPDGFYGWAASQYLQPAAAPPPPVSAPVIPGTATPRLLYTLEGEDPEETAAIERLRAAASLEGIEFDTADFGGVRTEADTIKILKYRDDDYAVYLRNLRAAHPGREPEPKTSWRPINPFGTSMHNFGASRDLKVTRYPSSFSKDGALSRLGALAPSVGLRWGGKFKRVDPPHFELPITLAEAKRRWQARQ